MKVAYFTESLPPKSDGVARTLANLTQTLHSRNIEYRFFCPFMPDQKTSLQERVFKVSSVPFLPYPYYRLSLPVLHNLFGYLDDFEPDIIHVASPTFLGKAGLNYALNKKLPAVSSYHTHFVSYFKYYGFQLMENVGWNYLKWFHNQFSRTFVPSPSTARELIDKGFENIDLWQRGIHLDKFSPTLRSNKLRKQIGAKQDEPILLFVGRLVKEKDLEDLIKADHILREQNYTYKMVIIGDGPMRPRLEQEIPNVYCPGFLKGRELSEWYASSDLFVFPSTTETFGNVILEACASGLPVIGVNMGGAADLIQHNRTGFIARPNDPEDFAEKTARLLENRELYKTFSKNARAYAQHYSWEAINGKLIQNYEQTIYTFYKN